MNTTTKNQSQDNPSKEGVSTITPKELDTAMTDLFGRRWQTQFSRVIGKNITTVNRWAQGKQEIPRYVEVIIWSLMQLRHHGITLPSHLAQAPLKKPQEGDVDF